MSYGFNRLFKGRRFVKLLIEMKLSDVTGGIVLRGAVGSKWALEVLGHASDDGGNVSMDSLST